MSDKLQSEEIAQINEWQGFFEYQPTWIFSQFIHCPSRLKCWFTGNQFGKNDAVVMDVIMRIYGIHPVEKFNLRPSDKVRIIRFASESLPNDPDAETKNTQYPAFIRRLPPSLIKKGGNITHRNARMVLYDPQGGDDIIIEFTGYNQAVQRQAGVQRKLIWLDESSPKSFYEEQLPRLFAADGDMIVTLTPAENLTWEFDEFFERAKYFYRTKYVRDYVYETEGKRLPAHEETDSDTDIAVFQAASDDNPTMTKEVIDDIIGLADDPSVIAIRRYGLFKQVSGIIFKDFDRQVHILPADEYFPNGIPHEWMMGRFVDYHEHNNWAISWLAISPDNEVFAFDEMDPSPERMVTLEIARKMASRSKDYKFPVNLADPLANKKQSNTGTSVIDDLNRIFYEFKREGLGTGGYWQSWDTKNTRGRDEVRMRLKNSRLVGRPFSNRVVKDGKVSYLPTLWILDNCRQTILSLKNWRKEEWARKEALVTKDEKDKPQQKWSHFCMCLEAAFKHSGFRPKRGSRDDWFRKDPSYYQTRTK